MPVYTVKQAAERIGISERRVRKLLEEDRFRRAVKIGRDWIIPVSTKEDLYYHPHTRGKDKKPRRGKQNNGTY